MDFLPFIDKDYRDTDSASFENEIFWYLKGFGQVIRQYRVPDRGDGRMGKIDFVVFTPNQKIAIEVDRKTPRKKSIFKVKSVAADRRIVLTREPFRIKEL